MIITNQFREFLFVFLDICNFKVSLPVDLILTNPFQIFIPTAHSFCHILLFTISSDEEVVTDSKGNTTKLTLSDRLANANSREEFVAIRDEIKAMPAGAEKTHGNRSGDGVRI